MKSICTLSPIRTAVVGFATLLTVCFTPSSSFAGTIPTSSVLPNYAIVSVGSGASIMMNSGPVNGKVLVGDDSNVTSAGGGGGRITGGVDKSGTTTGDSPPFKNLATPPVVNIVPASLAAQAFTDAATLSAAAAGLTPTQTFGSISGTQTITGNGGLNVINIASLSNPNLTLSGTSTDIFVINVSGSFSTNRAITLQGITAAQILWNFTGTGTVFSTSGGNKLYGTFLATSPGARFQFSSLDLTGALINTGGHIQFVSNSSMTFVPFTVTEEEVIPEPSSLVLFGTGLVAFAGVFRWRSARRFFRAG